MKANEIYFERNQGPWNWTMRMEITNFKELWFSNLKLITKLRLTSFALGQKLFGQFNLFTHVELNKNDKKVFHSTSINKWGLALYKSQKTFLLLDDGESLLLEGVEFFWPLIFKRVPFESMPGRVDKNTIHAYYKMPLAGTFCDCVAKLGPSEGFVELSTPWLSGRLILLSKSKQVLEQRFSRD